MCTAPRVPRVLCGVLVTLAFALSACGATPSPAPGPAATTPTSVAGPGAAAPINVVASTNVWGDIAKQIGGQHVNVTSIMSDPNADPHEFEADAKTAAAVSSAQFVIENGLGYDDFMDKLMSASPDSRRVVVTAADAMQISGPDANPHVWYDIAKVPDVATAISDQLAKLDPADAGTFMANAQSFANSLAPIDDAITAIKTKDSGAPIGYTERVPGYLVDAAGLKLATPPSFAQSIEDGNDPSSSDNLAMNAAITTKAIKVLLYNGQVTSPATEAVKQLAQKNGVAVVGVTETLPSTDKDFQDWQLRQIRDLTTALGS